MVNTSADDLRTLYEFLVSVLPAALVAKALTFAGVTAALVGLLKRFPWFETRKRTAAPVAAILIGIAFGFVTVQFDPDQWLLAIGVGIVIALSAVGGFSTVKNAGQAGGAIDSDLAGVPTYDSKNDILYIHGVKRNRHLTPGEWGVLGPKDPDITNLYWRLDRHGGVRIGATIFDYSQANRADLALKLNGLSFPVTLPDVPPKVAS